MIVDIICGWPPGMYIILATSSRYKVDSRRTHNIYRVWEIQYRLFWRLETMGIQQSLRIWCQPKYLQNVTLGDHSNWSLKTKTPFIDSWATRLIKTFSVDCYNTPSLPMVAKWYHAHQRILAVLVTSALKHSIYRTLISRPPWEILSGTMQKHRVFKTPVYLI